MVVSGINLQRTKIQRSGKELSKVSDSIRVRPQNLTRLIKIKGYLEQTSGFQQSIDDAVANATIFYCKSNGIKYEEE